MSRSRFTQAELKQRLERMYGPAGYLSSNWQAPIAHASIPLRSHPLTGIYGETDT